MLSIKKLNNDNINSNMLLDSDDKDKFENENYFPIFNNEFDLNPNIQYIYRMKKSELKNVENFKISNGFGKIKFKTSVDLTYLNLSEIVQIDKFVVQLYSGQNLPKQGEGLNKPAIITIKQMFDQEDNLKTLINGIKQNGGRFLKYNSEKGYLKFEVEKWIK